MKTPVGFRPKALPVSGSKRIASRRTPRAGRPGVGDGILGIHGTFLSYACIRDGRRDACPTRRISGSVGCQFVQEAYRENLRHCS